MNRLVVGRRADLTIDAQPHRDFPGSADPSSEERHVQPVGHGGPSCSAGTALIAGGMPIVVERVSLSADEPESAVTTTTTEYRYEHFRLSHMLADLRFTPGTPGPGDQLPALALETLDGDPITLDGLDRPHLFVFGSNTCPMTASAGGVLTDLHRDFRDVVRFVLVQVREAHPGEHIPQPATNEEKREHARTLRSSLGIPFTVAFDDLEGRFHTSLDPKPNAAYLVETGGRIAFRALWSRDEAGLRSALDAVAAGREPDDGQSTRMLRPMVASLGYIDEVVRAGGPRAQRDLLRSAPPMALMARAAGLLRMLPPARRGAALLAITAGAAVVALAVGALVLS
jgi:hypothetical protein